MEEHADAQAMQEEEVHPDVRKILEWVIPASKMSTVPWCAEESETETKAVMVGDLIDKDRDIRFDRETGKPMLMHAGVLAIAEQIGAEWLEPRADRITKDGFNYTIGIRFADGKCFYASGEADERNTDEREISGKFRQNQAMVRGMNKALIRGLGLYRVLLTEEEADEFKQPPVLRLKKEYEAKIQEMIRVRKEREQRIAGILDSLVPYVILPEGSGPYAGVSLLDVACLHEDEGFLEELTRSEEKGFSFLAMRLLGKRKKEAASQEAAAAEESDETKLPETEVQRNENEENEKKDEVLGSKSEETPTKPKPTRHKKSTP